MEFAAKELPQSVGSLEEEYGRTFPEVISEQQRLDLLTPVIDGIIELLQKDSLTVPSNALGRIHVFQHGVFQDFESLLGEKANPRAVALTDSKTGVVALNIDQINHSAQYFGVDLAVVLRASSAHELAGHSLIHREVWVPNDVQDIKDIPLGELRYKRKGVIDMPPSDISERHKQGASRFEEGIADYIRREVLRLARLPVIPLTYIWEVELVDILAEKLHGNNLLLRAIYSREGLQPFTNQLDTLYGDNSMQAVLEEMGFDLDLDDLDDGSGNDPYEYTKLFLTPTP